MQTNV